MEKEKLLWKYTLRYAAMTLDQKIRIALLLMGVAAAVVGTVLGVGPHPFDEIGGAEPL
ncbi:MAG: hypothetical protein HYU02_05970 [Thaumarchaeota archaeon]|nr:hypothetical protein [Nitrososphaerota archaeon]